MCGTARGDSDVSAQWTGQQAWNLYLHRMYSLFDLTIRVGPGWIERAGIWLMMLGYAGITRSLVQSYLGGGFHV